MGFMDLKSIIKEKTHHGKNLKINSIQVLDNLFGFQKPVKVLKSTHWLWRYISWHKRPFSTLLSKKTQKGLPCNDR